MTSEEAEFSGQQVMKQLEERRTERKKDWNRKPEKKMHREIEKTESEELADAG